MKLSLKSLGPLGSAADVGAKELGLSGKSDADKALEAAFGAVPGQMDVIGSESDARRKAALRANLAMFDPVDSLIARMYGQGAVAPPIDIDALFGPGTPPQQTRGYYGGPAVGDYSGLNDPVAVRGDFDAPGSAPSGPPVAPPAPLPGGWAPPPPPTPSSGGIPGPGRYRK